MHLDILHVLSLIFILTYFKKFSLILCEMGVISYTEPKVSLYTRKQMFMFEELTTIPYFLAKQQPNALCVWREAWCRPSSVDEDGRTCQMPLER